MTKRIGATELHREIGAVLHDIELGREAVVVTRWGRDLVALVHPDEYAALLVARERLKTHLATKTDD